jgi:hypothetical protein
MIALIRRIWRSKFVGLALLMEGLGGCATTRPPEPRIIIQEKVVPVKVACVPSNVGAAPQYPDTDDALKTAGSPERRYQLVVAGRDLRISRLGVVEPVIEGCRK